MRFAFSTLRFAPSPTAGADAWSAGVSGASQKYVDGIRNTQKDQAGKAVAAQAALLANFTEAVASGRWAAKVMARGTAYWKSQSEAKAANFLTGATAGKANYLAAAQVLYPYETQLQAQIDSMPSGTRAASLARFTTWMDGMIAFKQQYSG
jgi:hypothetical protein